LNLSSLKETHASVMLHTVYKALPVNVLI